VSGADGRASGVGGADARWTARAEAVLQGGASTGSKRARVLYGDDGEVGPTLFHQARGCHVTTAGGDVLLDCTMALGAVALGYADDGVTRRVCAAAADGNVAGLSHRLEVEVAERLCDVIPCAERVQFLKTGAEAIAAAVRIARACTGRDLVIGSGYFGWLDWCSDGAGVPAGVRADFRSLPFDDVAALEQAVAGAGDRLAAVVLEPFVERLASAEWMRAARRLCDRTGAVLVFDEIKTGFRLRTGGFQAMSEVVPDLAAFAKAMSNGFPLSAVVGRRAVMDAARGAWISSTLASESTALAAAAAVLDRHAAEDVCAALWRTGDSMRSVVDAARVASGAAGVSVDGAGPMWMLRFDDAAQHARFLHASRESGVLFKRGAYNFAALAHANDHVLAIGRAARAGFDAVATMQQEPR
jgi:glutamate-1-semialdehyde aminotransferase